MAIIYFPKSANLGFRDSFNPTYESLILATNPNTVLYMDYTSGINAATASNLYITASWAQTASVTILYASNSLSASYAGTASVALNAVAGGAGSSGNSQSYSTVTTSSTFGITASFWNAEQYVTIATGARYVFTSSDMPAANTASNLSLFVYNTATVTSSLVFPTSWIFIGINPTYITASKSAILSLKAFGSQVVAAWGAQY